MIHLEFHPAVITGHYIRGWMLAEMYAIAHIIPSRGMDDNETPEWHYDFFEQDLQNETRQDAENTLEESCGADQITLSNPFFAMGAQFDNASTDRIPELEPMTYEDLTRQQFQTPGSFMQSSQEDLLRPETLTSSYFSLGEHDPRHYFSSPIPYTSIEQFHSPASTPITRTRPTSLSNMGPQSSLLSHTTSAATAGSLDGSGVCPECGYKVSTAEKAKHRNDNVRRHIRERHRQSVKCPQCGQNFTRPSNMDRHITIVHKGHSSN